MLRNIYNVGGSIVNFLVNITIDKVITHFVPKSIDNMQPDMDNSLTELDRTS